MKLTDLKQWGFTLLLCGAAGHSANAQTFPGTYTTGPFSPNNIVVRVVGDGSAALTSAATKNFLLEFTPAGATTGKIFSLPTTSTTGAPALTVTGTSGSEGSVTLSGDGKYLLVMGYDATAGLAAVSGTTAAATPRVVGRFDWQGGAIFDTVRITDAFNAATIRAAASDNGTELWVSGSNSGVRYLPSFSATSTVGLGGTPTNLRYINIFNGQLYVSSASGAFQGVATVGTGLPTTNPQTTTLLPGFPIAAGPSAYDFYVNTAGDTVYVSDDRAVASGGGLQKWVKGANGTFTLTYTLNAGLASGLRSLARAGTDANGNNVFYATDAAALNNLVKVTDSGASSAFTVLATAPANTGFRGVEVLGAGSGSVTTPPATPTLSAVADDQKVTLTWTSSPTANSYTLYRATASGAEVVYQTGLGATSYTDTGLTNGTTYFYQVTASNTVGESPKSNEVSATPFLNPPAAPVLTASAATGLVQLSWTAPAHAVTYNLYRSTTTGTETLYKPGLTRTKLTEFGLTNGTTYFYQVTAVDAAGESVKSNEASVTKIAVNPFTALSANTENNATFSDLVNEGMYAPFYGNGHRVALGNFYLNAEGVGQGTGTTLGQFDGYFATRFDTTNIKNQIAENFGSATIAYAVQAISLKLTENNQSFTTPGNVLFNLSSDKTTEFGFKYADANQQQITDPYGPNDTLPGEELLEVYPFKTTGATNQFSIDTVPLFGSATIQNPTNPTAGADLLAAFSDPANRLTFVGRPQNADITGGTTTIAATPLVAATWNGAAFTSGATFVGQPQLAVTVAANPTSAIVTGSIALEGVNDLSAINPAAPLGVFDIQIRAVGSKTPLYENKNVTLTTTTGSPNGAFSLMVPNLPAGNYDVWIKGSKNLAVLSPSVAISATAGTVPNVLLNGGDTNNDNQVDPTDFGLFVSAYNSSAAAVGSGYDPTSDFNFDGIVDPTDFGIFVGDYNTAGAQ